MAGGGLLSKLLSSPVVMRFRHRHPRVNVLRLAGVIGAQGAGRSLSEARLAPAIRAAFTPDFVDAVALAINSPGGSPVQSALIAARIRELADEKQKPVYAFVEDVAASGGYWLACAADQIFVDRGSVIGSIGVISSGFGLGGLIERYGIERRVHTAGTRKSLLDPFRPERPEDLDKLRETLDGLHTVFIDHVKDRRGDRLKDGDDSLFSGEFWLGGRGVDLGLADGIGHLRPFMREKFGDNVRFRVIDPSRSRGLARLLGGGPARAPGLAGTVEELSAALEERALWARYGL